MTRVLLRTTTTMNLYELQSIFRQYRRKITTREASNKVIEPPVKGGIGQNSSKSVWLKMSWKTTKTTPSYKVHIPIMSAGTIGLTRSTCYHEKRWCVFCNTPPTMRVKMQIFLRLFTVENVPGHRIFGGTQNSQGGKTPVAISRP